MTAKIRAVNLDFIVKLMALDLGCHRFAQLVRQDESGFVLAVEVTSKLQSADALRAVHEDANRGQKIDKSHLARREDRSARHTELMVASLAFKFAARRDAVGIQAAAARANRLAFRFGPAQLAKRLVCLVFAAPKDGAQGQGPSFC